MNLEPGTRVSFQMGEEAGQPLVHARVNRVDGVFVTVITDDGRTLVRVEDNIVPYPGFFPEGGER